MSTSSKKSSKSEKHEPTDGRAGDRVRWLESAVSLEAEVIKGFGRGAKELGTPTANLKESDVNQTALDAMSITGVYFGWACLVGTDDVLPMVMNVGYSPYYGNKHKTLEAHIIKKYDHDFYHERLRLVIAGYMRPEANFNSVEALIEAIQTDIKETQSLLATPAGSALKTHPIFSSPTSPPSSSSSSSSPPDSSSKK